MSLNGWQSLFVGRDNEKQLLKDAWVKAKSGQPGFVVLRGESGFGKTTLVKELYSWLSQNENEGPVGYWPDTLKNNNYSININPSPEDFINNKSIPYLWWGIRWKDVERNKVESNTCALIEQISILAAHKNALEYKKREHDRGLNSGKIIAQLLGNLLPVNIVDIAINITEQIESYKNEKIEQLEQEYTIEEMQKKINGEETANLFAFFVELLDENYTKVPSIPLIIILDDAQWADEESLRVIDKLFEMATERKFKLLIVATHWEAEWYKQANANQNKNLSTIFNRLKLFTEHQQLSNVMEIIDCGKVRELDIILKQALPGLTENQSSIILKKVDGNPLMMQQVILYYLDEPYFFISENPRQPLSCAGEEEIGHIPTELIALCRKRFNKLDSELKDFICTASFYGMKFLSEFVIDTFNALKLHKSIPQDLFKLCISPHVIFTNTNHHSNEFQQRIYFELAKERLEKFSLREGRQQYTDVIAKVSHRWLKGEKYKDYPVSEQRSLFQCLINCFDNEGPKYFSVLAYLKIKMATLEPSRYSGSIPFWLKQEPVLEQISNDDFYSSLEISTFEQCQIQALLVRGLQYDSAICLGEKISKNCLTILSDTPGVSSLYALSQRILGQTYEKMAEGSQQKENQLQKSLSYFMQALKTRANLIENNKEDFEYVREYLSLKNKVINIYIKLEQSELALELALESVELLDKTIGLTKPINEFSVYLLTLDKIARIYGHRRDFDKALATYEKSLDLISSGRIKINPEWYCFHYENAINNIISTLNKLGGIERIYEYFTPIFEQNQEVISKIKNEFYKNNEHFSKVVLTRIAIAKALDKIDRRDKQWMEERLTLNQQLIIVPLEQSMEKYGVNLAVLASLSTTQERVADIFNDIDNTNLSLEYYRAAIETRKLIIEHRDRGIDPSNEKILVRDKVVEAFSYKSLSRLCSYTGQSKLSVEYSRSALKLTLSIFSEESEQLNNIKAAKLNLIFALIDNKDFQEATSICDEIVSSIGINGDSESIKNLNDRSRIQESVGDAYHRAGEKEYALKYYQRSFKNGQRRIKEFQSKNVRNVDRLPHPFKKLRIKIDDLSTELATS
ncbi:tetratricopeptide repeat protein [Colwellia sp. BRX8-3]|uniref:tetratricopeptide repeat protein n=1 Tax=Colwellia sp. BRX8-3 TaxID=2759837 RepID=UPI0015F4F9D3|nr:tetratricopeptide repeat protein [Colwellia sp. BRX8-3]MBA6356622.1 ATP-binding protein [Colwellia sp. BRX8-3]